jgi:hypothetical protein
LFKKEVTGKITEYVKDPKTSRELYEKMLWTPPPPQPKPITEIVNVSDLT